MRRRTLLASASVLVTGCSEVIPDPLPTETAETAPDATAETPTGSAPTDATTSEQSPGDETAEPTETATPSTPERRAAERIATARGHLADALAAYVGFAEGDDATLLSVTAATRITPSRVTNPAREARAALDGVPDEASDAQVTTARRLRGVGTFLGQGARCQARLRSAYSAFDYVVGRLYAERTGGVPTNLANMRENHDTARGHFETVEGESSVEDADAFDGVDADTYEAKTAQLRREVAAFGALPDALAALRRAVSAFAGGTSAYTNQSYRTAEREFTTAAEQYGSAEAALDALDAPEAVASTVEELVADAGVLAAAASDLATAAKAGSEGRRDPREEAYESATDRLRAASERVRGMDSVERLLR